MSVQLKRHALCSYLTRCQISLHCRINFIHHLNHSSSALSVVAAPPCNRRSLNKCLHSRHFCSIASITTPEDKASARSISTTTASESSSTTSSPSAASTSSSNASPIKTDYLNLSSAYSTPFVNTPSKDRFALSTKFINAYKTKSPPFGYNGLGELVYLRTYSRKKDDGTNEQWWETVERVVNGTYNMQKAWIESHGLGWNAWKAQRSAQEMYSKIFEMKFLPPGRGLWAMGSPLTEQRGLFASLNNCAFVSTDSLKDDPAKPFLFLMDASMLGVGVGFDTKGANTVVVRGCNSNKPTETFTIPDSREGWVEALQILLNAHFYHRATPKFDYSLIRPYGTPIKGFGGLASGPAALQELLDDVRATLQKRVGQQLTTTDIVDIMNFIGRCVVAGNVRRCLPGSALVHTRDGLIPIKDVKVGQDVLTSFGYEKVLNWFDQGMREMVKIKTEDGEFVCTPNHRMPVLVSSDTYKWIEASELRQEDCLITSRTPIEGIETALPTLIDEVIESSRNPVVVPSLDGDLAWLIGMLHSGNNNRFNKADMDSETLVLRFARNEVDLATRTQHQLQRFGNGSDVTLEYCGQGESICVQSNWKLLNAYIKSQLLLSHFDFIIPNYILQACQSVKLGYIAGIIDQSRSLSIDNGFRIPNISDEFAKQLQVVLYSCGLETSLRLQSSGPASLDFTSGSSLLAFKQTPQLLNTHLLQACADRIARECLLDRTVSQDKHNESMKILPSGNRNEFGYTKVLGVEDLPIPMYTYDIQVETNHEFYCNGYLTHNTAEIAFGDPSSDEYLDLKNYNVNPQRAPYGWTSNNSIFATVGMNYESMAERVRINGEPGLAWLDNMQNYARMNGTMDRRDFRAKGGNPCLEQTLESYELCCLVETFPHRHVDIEDFKRTLKFAYLYAKTVTLGKTHWPETNRVMLRNRRIGCSVSGVAQFLSDKSLEQLRQWLEGGYEVIQEYDRRYSEWLAIPRSIKTTSVKPSGTVSLLAGATPGMHYPESRFYIRRVRLAANSALLTALTESGYHLEAAENDPQTMIVSIPIDVGANVRTSGEVSMWEQLALASFLQRHWADNQVSCTVTFDPDSEGPQIQHALQYYQYQLKGVSFLPRTEKGAYKQMPYEEITKAVYDQLISELKPLSFMRTSTTYEDNTPDRFCDTDSCNVEPSPSAEEAADFEAHEKSDSTR